MATDGRLQRIRRRSCDRTVSSSVDLLELSSLPKSNSRNPSNASEPSPLQPQSSRARSPEGPSTQSPQDPRASSSGRQPSIRTCASKFRTPKSASPVHTGTSSERRAGGFCPRRTPNANASTPKSRSANLGRKPETRAGDFRATSFPPNSRLLRRAHVLRVFRPQPSSHGVGESNIDTFEHDHPEG